MAQKKDSRKFIVDTFAIISDLIGNITPKASEALELIRLGTATGVIHYLVAYEFVYFWERTKLIFKSPKEVKEFISAYFKLAELDVNLAAEAAKIKVEGDRLLKSSSETKLRRRHLSIADATTIALALKHNASIITGDEDLKYVASHLGIGILW